MQSSQKYILGISAFYHDSAAAILRDGEIIAAAQEERFTRKKHDPGFPIHAIRYCLKTAGISLNALEAIAFYDKPLLKFERLLETYYDHAPRGIRSFWQAIPVWLKEKLFFKRLLKQNLLETDANFIYNNATILFPEHHLSHQASAFFPSPFKEAAIITLDGVGEWTTTSIAKGTGEKIEVLREIHFPHSLGLLYSSFTYFLGFKVNSGEYKMMGLAPYGQPDSEELRRFIDIIKNNLIKIKPDGSFQLQLKYFTYPTGLRMVDDQQWGKLFGLPARKPESELLQSHCNIALAIQKVTEEIILKIAKTAKDLTGSDNLCLAGGVALNCVANGQIQNEKLYKNIFIQPAAGDAGGALGAGLAAHYIYFNNKRKTTISDSMQGSYLGPSFDELDIGLFVRDNHIKYKKYSNFKDVYQVISSHLAKGKIVGWFQGRMEYGPRALGNRSILGNPRKTDMQKKLNLKIKYRESFRPFAPAVLAERVLDYFSIYSSSPYMLLVQSVLPKHRNELPENYPKLPIKEKLYYQRSNIPAVTHIDFSARIQTVHKETNPKFHQLLQAFEAKTGCPMLVNTSFNVRGEPIVCTPEDAYRCFMHTEMDYLVMENFIFDKKEQPAVEKSGFENTFELD